MIEKSPLAGYKNVEKITYSWFGEAKIILFGLSRGF